MRFEMLRVFLHKLYRFCSICKSADMCLSVKLQNANKPFFRPLILSVVPYTTFTLFYHSRKETGLVVNLQRNRSTSHKQKGVVVTTPSCEKYTKRI